MGSGQSSQPQQTQSAPPTARTTPKPRRNQQFQEVQLNPTGGNPKGRPTGRAQGSSPNPHQATNPQGRSGQRGQDPGASGSQTDRSTRQQQQQPRQAAAANGKRNAAMAGSQQDQNRVTFEELLNSSRQTNTSEIYTGDNPAPVDGMQTASVPSSGAVNSSSTVQQMVNDHDNSHTGSQTKTHVTGTAQNKPGTGKKKNTVILVKPGKPVHTNKQEPGKDIKGSGDGKSTKPVGKDAENKTNNTNSDKQAKEGILKKSKIFRPGLKGITEEKEEEKSRLTNADNKGIEKETKKSKETAKKAENKQSKNVSQKLAPNKTNQNGNDHGGLSKTEVGKDNQSTGQMETSGKDHKKEQPLKYENKNNTKENQDISPDEAENDSENLGKLKNKAKEGSKAKNEHSEFEVSGRNEKDANSEFTTKKDMKETFEGSTHTHIKAVETEHQNELETGNEMVSEHQGNMQDKEKEQMIGAHEINGKEQGEYLERKISPTHDVVDLKKNTGVTNSQTKKPKINVRDQNGGRTTSKKLMDESGYLNLDALDRVTDHIQRLHEARVEETLSQLSYDKEFGDDEDSIGNASDLSHDIGTESPASEVGASKADDEDAEVLSMKDDDIVFETFYHRSGKEFQCIYQTGMRFYLDDWGSKEWQPFPKRWYNEGLLVTNTILRDDGTEQARNEQAGGASSQGQSRSQGRGQGGGGGGGGGGSDDREGFIDHPTRGRVPTYIFYKKHNVHMYFDKGTGSWVRLPIGWELHHDMVKSLVDQVDEAVPTWGDRHDILALLRACNYDPDECISIYLHLEKDEWIKAPKTSKDAKAQQDKDNKISALEKKVKDLELQLQKEKTQREELERNLDEQTNKMSDLEVESKQTEAQLSAMTGGRPKSARPISVMMMAGKGAKGAKGGKQSQAGEVVNPDDVLDLNANAKALRKAHTKLKMEAERFFGDFKHIVLQVGPAIKQMKQAEKGTQSEIEEVRALYRKEALQRKLLYNQLQELRGNIRVFCRVRKDDRAEMCLKFPSDQDIVATNQQAKKMFNFDKVFEPSSTQEQVFEDTKPIVTSCADGYNVCLLAYGQTGSGKTFTMMGPESNPGINIRAMKELFQVTKERQETMSYKLTVSLVEIYNETIQDLLTSDAKTLELRTAGNKVNIPGLTEYPIENLDDVKKIMTMGDKNRSVASTKMNSTSSRSHLVLMLAVEGKDKVTAAVSRGTLVLCDLAGSERIAKTEAEGQRLVEAAAINKSLSALGQVFTALRTSQMHVPYRNSKLTQILQPSLGGDAKACLFVNVSPDSYNFLETVSTLTFGSNARQVALGQAKQNISKGNR